MTYTTIGRQAQRTSQRAFLRNLARGEAYSSEAPTMWDVDFQSAVAQAEMEDREIPGSLPPLGLPCAAMRFSRLTPLAPNCWRRASALSYTPKTSASSICSAPNVTTPVFGAQVPVETRRLVDLEKGTGAVMVCTFGDVNDVISWRELQLASAHHRSAQRPRRRAGLVEHSVRRRRRGPGCIRPNCGLKLKPAQDKMVELLRESRRAHR